MRGVLLSAYDSKRQRYVVRSWQKGNGGPTPDRLLAQASFKQSITIIKQSVDLDVIASVDMAKGTPYLPRDLRMKASFGTLIIATLKDGTVLQGGRQVAVNVSDLLDQISDLPGSLLQRGPDGWQAVAPGTVDGFVVTWDAGLNLWLAKAPSGGGGGAEASIKPWTDVAALPGFDPSMIYKASATLSNSNKSFTAASSGPYNYWYGTTARFTGKLYAEIVPGSSSFCRVGWCGGGGRLLDNGVGSPGNFGEYAPGQIGWGSSGTVVAKGVTQGSGTDTITTVAGWSSGNRLCLAIDVDARLGWFRVNAGNWNNDALSDPATGSRGINLNQIYSGASNLLTWIGGNSGNTSLSSMYQLAADFTETVPTGFKGWSDP